MAVGQITVSADADLGAINLAAPCRPRKMRTGASTPSISSQTIYPNPATYGAPANRVVFKSNPKRSTAATTGGRIRSTTDLLSRTIDVSTFQERPCLR
jgi:hypothetical protein